MFLPKTRQPDGQVLSSNLKINDHKNPSDLKYNNFGLHKVMLLTAIPVDDKNNKYKQGVEYTGVIVGGPRDGEFISNLQPSDGFGGKDNFFETVYTPKTEVIRGSNKGDKTATENTDGSFVLVSFLNGHQNSPIIMGGYRQPNNENYGATKDDGTVCRGQFQGLSFKVDKEGIFTLEKEGTTLIVDANSGGVFIDTDKDVKINSATKIELGTNATQSFVLGEAFQSLFNGHTHSGGSVPDQQMGGSHKSSLIKGK